MRRAAVKCCKARAANLRSTWHLFKRLWTRQRWVWVLVITPSASPRFSLQSPSRHWHWTEPSL